MQTSWGLLFCLPLKVKYIICYELELFIQPMKTQVMQTEIT